MSALKGRAQVLFRCYSAGVSVQPPQGQFSPDGRWWWDGTKWTPVSNPSAMQPSSQVVPQLQSQGYPPVVYTYGPRSNSYAVASLIFGILSWFLCPLVGGVVAVVLGHVARGQIRRSGEGGAGLAIAGLILGYAHLAVFGLVI